jgi:hypothetical protein
LPLGKENRAGWPLGGIKPIFLGFSSSLTEVTEYVKTVTFRVSPANLRKNGLSLRVGCTGSALNLDKEFRIQSRIGFEEN